MSYNKTRWINGSAPAINATNLNNIENGIEDVDSRVTALETDPTTKEYVDEKLLEETTARILADEELQNQISSLDGGICGYIKDCTPVYSQGTLTGYSFDGKYFPEFQKELCFISAEGTLYYSIIGKNTNTSSITSRTFYSLTTNVGAINNEYSLFRHKLVYSYYNTTLAYSIEKVLSLENNLSNLSWGSYPPTSNAVNAALNNKQNKLPDVSSTGTYVLKSINGILTWVQE